MKCGLIQLDCVPGKLSDIQFARRKQNLAVLPVDRVAVDVGWFVKRVIRAQRLHLRHGVVERSPVPQTHVIEQWPVLRRIDRRVRVGMHFDLAHARSERP